VDCDRARALLLEADLADLLPGSGTELARHLGACAACRREADRILLAEHHLAAWLEEARPLGDADRAVARARAAARRRAVGRRVGTFGGLAVAAALVAVLLLPRRSAPPGPPVLPPLQPATGFSVTAPPGREVIVLHTANPKIVVVWFLPSRRSS
jgi:predicted anti-sigma-YlaC factor YlaD